MKKNFSIIQINGIKGILYMVFIGVCLAVGFGWFPGWLCMKLWNFSAVHINNLPSISIFQGLLLWGIIAASYYTFRKDKPVVCMHSSEGLSEEELRAVFADMQKQAKDDVFLKSLFQSRDAQLRIKNLSESNIPKTNMSKDKLHK